MNKSFGNVSIYKLSHEVLIITSALIVKLRPYETKHCGKITIIHEIRFTSLIYLLLVT